MDRKVNSTRALLLMDLQNDIAHPEGKIGAGGLAQATAERGVLRRASRLLAAARVSAVAVAHVRLGFRPDYRDSLSVAPRIKRLREVGAAVVGTWGTAFLPEVAPTADELIFTKQCVNPFVGTGLQNWLAGRSIRELYLGGVATNMVVEATARTADDLGFAVSVVEDCCAGASAAWHQFAVENMLPLFGRVITSEEAIAEFTAG